jgi:proline iminopeptidase
LGVVGPPPGSPGATEPFYPPLEPYEHGLLDIGDGNLVYWEGCGNPGGKPALAVHGGPGSGAHRVSRRYFDPERYRIVLFDQRHCGRSTPSAGDPRTDLSTLTTHALVADMERLREHLGVDRWLLLGGSWGSLLSLAYAVEHPDRVTELILFGVATGRHSEIDWIFRGGLARFFPQQWDDVLAALPEHERGGDVLAAYVRALEDEDPEVRRRATDAWSLWESATPKWPPEDGLARRFRDPDFAYAFARLVTYVNAHNAWLEDGELLARAHVLRETPVTIVNGRFDFQSPVGNAWELRRALPHAELVVVDDAGHSGSAALDAALVAATDAYR